MAWWIKVVKSYVCRTFKNYFHFIEMAQRPSTVLMSQNAYSGVRVCLLWFGLIPEKNVIAALQKIPKFSLTMQIPL